MSVNREDKHPETRSPHEMQGWGFDEEFQIPTVLLMAWDRTNNVLRRVELIESANYPGQYEIMTAGSGGGTTSSTYGSGVYGTATYS